MAAAANSDPSHSWCVTVTLKQTDKNWSASTAKATIGLMPVSEIRISGGNKYINVEWFRADKKPPIGDTERRQSNYGEIFFYSDNTRLYEGTVNKFDFYDASTGERYKP